ncbi:hypothetical protein [Kribbella ginsengisoli]|uniref:Uncharacterized protein n=1 Tax=Kribbella ginsengisoli TaxID=363865 RepID=A0ABP6Y3Z8_9ACTN
MSQRVYRNGKLQELTDAQWREAEKARLRRAASNAELEKTLVDRVESKGGKTVVTTRDGKKHVLKGIGAIAHNVGNIILGSTGPVHTGNGDMYVNGQKQPKRNPWY